MTDAAKVLTLGCGHTYKSYGGNALFFSTLGNGLDKLSINSINKQ